MTSAETKNGEGITAETLEELNNGRGDGDEQ